MFVGLGVVSAHGSWGHGGRDVGSPGAGGTLVQVLDMAAGN